MKWLIILFIAIAGFGACNKSMLPEESATVQQTIRTQQYVFDAMSANPMGGGNIQLTPGYYDLRITPSEIIATLPYYGRAYSAPIDPSQGGLRFTSKRFRYTATQGNKEDWDIVIAPEDAPGVRELRLSISKDGYATLYVTHTDRQPITFNGRVKNMAATP